MRYHEIIIEAGWRYRDEGPRLGASDYERILRTRRELEGLRAAVRDPQTGTVYVGGSHQAAIDKVPPSDETGAWGRLCDEWYKGTENTGYIDREGNFISRDEAERRWDILTVEDLRDKLKAMR